MARSDEVWNCVVKRLIQQRLQTPAHLLTNTHIFCSGESIIDRLIFTGCYCYWMIKVLEFGETQTASLVHSTFCAFHYKSVEFIPHSRHFYLASNTEATRSEPRTRKHQLHLAITQRELFVPHSQTFPLKQNCLAKCDALKSVIRAGLDKKKKKGRLKGTGPNLL